MDERVVEIGKETPISLKISQTALMIALNCVVTMSFSVYIPASEGYFNIGESMVYLSAILFGPYIGGLAGGIGGMLADLLLGFPVYAPATLVIKGIEGFTVGTVYRVMMGDKDFLKKIRTPLFFIVGFFAAGIVMLMVITVLSPRYNGFGVFFELVMPEFLGTVFWIIVPIAIVILLAIFLIMRLVSGDMRNKVVSMLVGGIIIVAGYYFYGLMMYGPSVVVEIPFNITQCLVGILIATPLSGAISRRIS